VVKNKKQEDAIAVSKSFYFGFQVESQAYTFNVAARNRAEAERTLTRQLRRNRRVFEVEWDGRR
jgi:hypothetical protein